MDHEDTYFIPANFADAGRVFGMFELRNCIEAVVLAAPTLGICMLIAHQLAVSLTIKLLPHPLREQGDRPARRGQQPVQDLHP